MVTKISGMYTKRNKKRIKICHYKKNQVKTKKDKNGENGEIKKL